MPSNSTLPKKKTARKLLESIPRARILTEPRAVAVPLKHRSNAGFTVRAIRGKVLGVNVYRGYARLCDLALVSRPDIYNVKDNPTGTQRDLSPKHAREAYLYVSNSSLAFWPEILLCARDKKALEFSEMDADPNVGTLHVRADLIARALATNKIMISRVDGNHRLHYADGTHEGFPAVEKVVSFCIAYDLDLNQEIALFRDINNNQRKMNTSHLDNIEAKLTEKDRLKIENPELYIARLLNDDKSSPLAGLIYDGGKRLATTFIPLRTLRTGLEYMFSRPSRLTAIPSVDARYRLIKNYFLAIKRWIPESWTKPTEYLALRGAGLWGICFLGAEVIDRTLGQGNYKPEDMLKVLKSGATWDWSNDGDFTGFSGRGGAVRIRDAIVSELVDEKGISVRQLFEQIMKD